MKCVVGAALLLLCCCYSCKTKQKVTTTTEKLSHQSVSFQSLSAKSTIALFQGEKQLFSTPATLRIKRDSLIILSIQPIAGVEVARFSFDTDHVCIINRMNKQYVQSSYESLLNNQDTSMKATDFYHALQSVFCSELFFIDSGQIVDVQDFSITQMEGNRFLQHASQNLMQEFSVDDSSRITTGTLFSESFRMKWNYSQYEAASDTHSLPIKTHLSVQSTPQSKLDLDITYKKLEIDTDCSFSNTIPDSYQQVTWEELLSALHSKK